MIAWIITACRGLWSKATVYVLAFAAIAIVIWDVIRYVRQSAVSGEKLKTATEQLRNQERDRAIAEDIDRLPINVQRERLRERWGTGP